MMTEPTRRDGEQQPISRLLVANRAEIASRVFRTCRRLGIETVAVHSDADAQLPFVRDADVAVPLFGDTPAETYLDTEKILDAARRTGADAIHPGYGFLSENADFARAVIDAGLTWVGPAPEAIEQMGSKVAAKALMQAAGVPVLRSLTPGTATADDLPLIVKASAGGGGRGMRIVRSVEELPAEMEAARAEAESAFGDGTVFVETYVEQGRHIEVQVVGHRDGVLVLGERDCSIQRRHQKVVEESPAPGLPDSTRQRLHEAAAAAAAAIDYRGAGTVEFMYDEQADRFYFLEMNTRLQVEHPVTELVHGVDLVDLQLSVAEDRPIDPRAIGEAYGHAIEVRLYAEDPAADYQPQSGRISLLEVPGVDAEFDLLNRPGLRLDAGFETGNEVSTHYDAMLGKLVAWAPTRGQAARRLADALAKSRIHGVRTNRDLLVEVLHDTEFLGGRVSTAFLGDAASRLASLSPQPAPAGERLAAHAATVVRLRQLAARRTVQQPIPTGWRNVHGTWHTMAWQVDRRDEPVEVRWSGGRDIGFPDADIEVLQSSRPDEVRLRSQQEYVAFRVTLDADGGVADVDSIDGHVRLDLVPRFTDPASVVASGSLLAPMPGTVVKVSVELGDQVSAGQPVLVLEAMKMQHTVSAPTDGTLARLDVRPGAQVASGEVLAVVEPHDG